MFKSILPRDEAFFDMLDKVAANTVIGAELLCKIINEQNLELSQDLKTVEHATDEIVHAAMQHLHGTFVTPFDRNDIQRLFNRLDDVLDYIHAAGSTIRWYKPKRFPSEISDMASVILQSTRLVKEMVELTRKLSKNKERIMALTVEINRLENDADRLRRSILGRLFDEEKDPFELIKWKDIIQYMEKVTDRCEDVGNVIEGIVLENQ